ncbi:MAG: hypothetical protein QOJ84_3773 [Bradyrhizobium sp.]|jgi:hypothetical protein|nr:hypothetical protein [Bradyrhizobium sp.]
MNADTLIVDGRAYSWRRLCELRRAQIEAQNRARLRQLALFELREDSRPATERTAADRYLQPSLLDLTQPSG